MLSVEAPVDSDEGQASPAATADSADEQTQAPSPPRPESPDIADMPVTAQQSLASPATAGGGSSVAGSGRGRGATEGIEEWMRRRVFQLRVPHAPSELISVFQVLDDNQLQTPFTEVKMWLGLDEEAPLSEALERLVLEYRDARYAGPPPPKNGMSPNAKTTPPPSGLPASRSSAAPARTGWKV